VVFFEAFESIALRLQEKNPLVARVIVHEYVVVAVALYGSRSHGASEVHVNEFEGLGASVSRGFEFSPCGLP
jgi:hypothetical protein